MSIILMSLLYTGKYLPPGFFWPLLHSLSVGKFKTGEFERFKLFLNTTLSRRIQNSLQVNKGEIITLYTLLEIWQKLKVWILKDSNLVYKL